MDLDIIRHKEIYNPEDHDHIPVNIIGCGATGSRIFMALIELGVTNIRCYDPDVVEAHNLANQAFTNDHLGMPKVVGLSRLYHSKLGVESPKTIQYHKVALPHKGLALEGAVLLLTDTMKSRREIYDSLIKGNEKVSCLVETRMASTHGNSYCFDPRISGKAKAWVDSFIDDDDGETSACGASISVGTTASIIANLAVWQFINFNLNEGTLVEAIDIFMKPFFTCVRGQIDGEEERSSKEKGKDSRGQAEEDGAG